MSESSDHDYYDDDEKKFAKKKDDKKKWKQVTLVPSSERFKAPWQKYTFILKKKKLVGVLEETYSYEDGHGNLLGHVGRYKVFGHPKQFVPFTYRRHSDTNEEKWRPTAFDLPRPLYGLPHLAKNSNKPVLIPEGEKAVLAARKIFPAYAIVTWPGGNSGVGLDKEGNERVDLTPLVGRDVTIWPDNDLEGLKEAAHLVDSLRRLGIEPKQVDVPPIKELNNGRRSDGELKSWDLADTAPEWLDIHALLREAGPAPTEEQSAAAATIAAFQGGRLIPTEYGLSQALQFRPELHEGGLVAFDKFTGRELLMLPIPGAPMTQLPRPWVDNDTTYFIEWLQSKGVKVKIARGIVDAAINAHADRMAFDSLQDRFVKLPKWDGKKRMERFFLDVCVAEMPKLPGDPKQMELEQKELNESYGRYLAAVARCMFMSIIARVYEPGSKVDTMTVLESLQGKLKSTLLRVLALDDDWFSDNLPSNIQSKDAKAHLAGKLIVEMSELNQFKGVNAAAALKTFLSTQEEKFRLPYGRRDINYKRRNIFVGTTNDHTYLVDETGNRRYFPLRIAKINLKLAKDTIEQIYAEAMERRYSGENANWWMADEEEALAEVEQRSRLSDDVWEVRVIEHLKALAVQAKEARDFEFEVTIADLLAKLGIDLADQHRGHQTRMGIIIAKYRGEKYYPRVNGRQMTVVKFQVKDWDC